MRSSWVFVLGSSLVIFRACLLGFAAAAAASCSSIDWRPSGHLFARNTSDLGVDRAVGANPQRRIYASLRSDVPAGFTGCLAETNECYVVGEYVEARIRFEPQTGRFWFLDPSSGNTYFEDGELRTGDPYRVRPELVPREGIYPRGNITLN